MMFSVVIPVYNKEKVIRRTIESVLNQSYEKFEIIIINDGSNDMSMKVVQQFFDPRIKIIDQVNMGVSEARNKGIKEAKYEHIAFLDADDTWGPYFLETVDELIDLYPNAGAYYTNYELVAHDNVEYNNDKTRKNILISDYFGYSLKNQPICNSSVVVRKQVFNNVGLFPSDLLRGEDIYMWINIALNYKIANSDYIGAQYFRNLENSLTKTSVPLSKSLSNIAEKIYIENKDNVKNKDNFKEYMTTIIVTKARYLIKDNQRSEARILLKKYKNTKNSKKKVVLLFFASFSPDIIINKFL